MNESRPSWWEAFIDRFERLETLIGLRVCDDEDAEQPINTSSQFHAQNFAATLGQYRKPAVFIDLQGRTRLVWDQGDEQVALCFTPKKRVEFVLLRHYDGENIDDLRGTVGVAVMLLVIKQFGVEHVMLDE